MGFMRKIRLDWVKSQRNLRHANWPYWLMGGVVAALWAIKYFWGLN